MVFENAFFVVINAAIQIDTVKIAAQKCQRKLCDSLKVNFKHNRSESKDEDNRDFKDKRQHSKS